MQVAPAPHAGNGSRGTNSGLSHDPGVLRPMWWAPCRAPVDPLFNLRAHLFVQGKMPGAVTHRQWQNIRCYCCAGSFMLSARVTGQRRALILIRIAQTMPHPTRQAPVLALWGARGTVGKLWDVLATLEKSCRGGYRQGAALWASAAGRQPELVLAAFRSSFGS